MNIGRREVLSGGLASIVGALVPYTACAQRLLPIRLIVLRQPAALSNHCVAPCIRGLVYDISHLTRFDLHNLALPAVKALPPICGVIERPYHDNRASESSIPRGIYTARIRDDATKRWMTTLDRRWRLELDGVPGGRSAIRFHYGQDVDWSKGCFIVGSIVGSDGSLTREAYCGVDSSEASISKLRRVVTGAAMNSNDMKIVVADDGELFPRLSGSPICG
jgi:hypothetical protein